MEHWGRTPLLSPRASLPRPFDDLLNLATAGELLSRRGLRSPFLRVAKGGVVVNAARYTRPGGVGAMVADQVADDRVADLLAEGHTVVLQGLHRLWPSLIDFAGDLTTDLGHPVQVNAYITPAGSQGFAAHYDTHDVFVLQVAGRKQWRVHEPVIRDPMPTEPWSDRRDEVRDRATEPPLIDATLAPGDALYLPRGYLHSADALGETTLHLTVGVHPMTGRDVVEAAAALVSAEPSIRRSLPMSGDAAELTAAVTAAVASLTDHLCALAVDDVVHQISTRQVQATRPAPLDPLAQADSLRTLEATTRIAVRRNLRVTMRSGSGEVELVLPGRTLRLPATCRAALETLLHGASVQVADLPELDEADALTLARRLLREGVVVAC